VGGGWLSLLEHLRTSYEIDKVKPEKWEADKRTLSKGVEFSKSIKPAIVGNLVEMGMREDEANEAVSRSLKDHRPSWLDRLSSSARRGAEFVGRQVDRIV
jgi:hypothetical protein